MNPKPSPAKGMPRSRSSPSTIGLNPCNVLRSPRYKIEKKKTRTHEGVSMYITRAREKRRTQLRYWKISCQKVTLRLQAIFCRVFHKDKTRKSVK